MKYCPKCKTEYQNWVKLCADCSEPLVDKLLPELSEEKLTVIKDGRENLDDVKSRNILNFGKYQNSLITGGIYLIIIFFILLWQYFILKLRYTTVTIATFLIAVLPPAIFFIIIQPNISRNEAKKAEEKSFKERNINKREAEVSVISNAWTCPSCTAKNHKLYDMCEECGQPVIKSNTLNV